MKPVVGIAPMAYCDPRLYWDKDQATYDRYISKLAHFSAWLIRNHYPLRLLTTDIWFDSHSLTDLEKAITSQFEIDTSPWIIREPINGIDDLLSQLAQVDCIVTSKFHGVIFAHLLNRPVLAISHHPKVATLMSDLGLSDYYVDIRTFETDLLTQTYSRLLANADQIRASMPKTVAAYRRGLATQFDHLFSPESRRCVRTAPILRPGLTGVPPSGY